MRTKSTAREPQSWLARFDSHDKVDYGCDVGQMHTRARAVSDRSHVAAAARVFDREPVPHLDILIASPGIKIVGGDEVFLMCEWRDPQALRDLADVFRRVADQAEAAGVFAALKKARRSVS